MRLACKLLYGVQHVIEAFPRKRYFFKIDDDTVWCVPFRKHTRHYQACVRSPPPLPSTYTYCDRAGFPAAS